MIPLSGNIEYQIPGSEVIYDLRRFTLEASNCSEGDRRIWQDAGFQLAEPQSAGNPLQRPDLALRRLWPEQKQVAWDELERLLPRVFVIFSEQEIPFPSSISAVYTRRCFAGKSGQVFTVGSTLEEMVAEPVWEAYRFGDQPAGTEEMEAVAGSLYQYLLLDLFRETAEWCGHMSSVVGPA